MIQLIKKIAVACVPALLLASCTKEPLNNLSNEQARIYTTNYDPAVNFGDFKTYSISDSATLIDNGVPYKVLADIDIAYMNAVDTYMQQRGYLKVSKDENPDIGININRIYSTVTGVIDNSTYWDYYGGYWDPYYWGYGGYGYGDPYGYGVYSYTSGAESVDMLDLKNAAVKGKIDIVWTGLVRGEGILNTVNADSSVKALFDQSPYLQAQ